MVRIGTVLVLSSLSEVDLTGEVDLTRCAEVDPTRCAEVDPTRRAEVDLTRRSEVDLTRRAEVDPTRRAEVDPTCSGKLDPTCAIEVDPTRGGVGVETLRGELNSKRATSGVGDRGGSSGDTEARSSDRGNVLSSRDRLMSPECTLRVSGRRDTSY